MRYYGTTLIPITLWYSRIRRQPYPIANVSGGGLAARGMAAVCRAEERVGGADRHEPRVHGAPRLGRALTDADPAAFPHCRHH